ncbi:MAG: MATE family efflux transporter [Chloroflexi bacterium]|nr:MATE family efflux transporter [Chloroflexota bacterium]
MSNHVDQPAPGAGSASPRRRVLRLAMPIIGENLLQTLLGVVDTILVAGLGAAALAGVGTALFVIPVIIAVLTPLSGGAAVLVAQAYGARDAHRVAVLARQALLWSILVSAPLAVLGIAGSGPVISWFGLGNDANRMAVEYSQITLGTVTTLAMMTLLGGVLRGVGDSRTPMLVTGLVNLLNIGLSWVLIYGAPGIPALGASGSAWGSCISRLIGALILLGLLWRGWSSVRLGGAAGSWRPSWPIGRRIIGLGLPAAGEEILILTAIAALTPLVAPLGDGALAAHRIVMNVLSVSYLPGIGFAIATTALVAQAVGAGLPHDSRALTNAAALWSALWMGGLGMVFFIIPEPVIRLYQDDPQLIALGAPIIRLVAAAQVCWALTFVYGGALRGVGDTRTPMVISSLIHWLVVACALLLDRMLSLDLLTIWLLFVVVAPIEAGLLWRAWRRIRLQQVVPLA